MKKVAGLIGLGATLMLTLTSCMTVEANIVLNPDGETAVVESVMSYNKEKMTALMSMDSMDFSMDSTDLEDATTDQTSLVDEFNCSSIQEMSGQPGEGEEAGVKWEETDTHCIMRTSDTVKYDGKGKVTILGEKAENEAPGASLASEEGFSILKDGNTVTVVLDTGSSMGNELEQAKMMIDDFTVSVTYPGKILEANNKGVISDDNKTVTWDLLDKIDGQLEVEGTLSDTNLLPLVGGGAAVVLLGAGAALILSRKKREKALADAKANSDLSAE